MNEPLTASPLALEEGESPGDRLPRALRYLGAALLVTAASSFMFREWGVKNDVERYLMLLAQLGLLTVAGFFCGLRVRERRGARTFLGLVIAVIPVHFAVLGGVLYSQLALDAPRGMLPGYAVWKANDAATALWLVLGAQLLIVPATLVAMLTLARRHAWPLTAAYLVLNALLLVPMRATNTMALLLLVTVPLLLQLQLRVFHGSPTLSTPLGRFARAALALPIAILAARTLMHYPLTAPFTGVLLLGAGLAVFAYALRLSQAAGRAWIGLGQWVGLASMLAGWFVLASDGALRLALMGELAFTLEIAFAMLPAALVLWTAAGFLQHGERPCRRVASLAAGLAVCVMAIEHEGIVPRLLCLMTGVLFMYLGAKAHLRSAFMIGLSTALIGLLSAAALAIRVDMLTHWGSLTVLGTALIFLASALERNRQRLLRHLSGFRGKLREWHY